METADIDLIFSNILLTEDGKRHVLDYEWTFEFPVPAGFLAYRAIHYYFETSAKRKILKEDLNLYETAEPLAYFSLSKKTPQRIKGGITTIIVQ